MKKRKLRQNYNSMHQEWILYKEKKKEQFDIMSNRKADEEAAR